VDGSWDPATGLDALPAGEYAFGVFAEAKTPREDGAPEAILRIERLELRTVAGEP
jgi:hypothetical protein